MVDNIRRCSDCKHFVSLHGGEYIGICTCSSNSFSYLPMTDFPQIFDCPFYHPKTSKVKPIRLCDFCERHKLIDDEYDRYKIGCVKLIPLPAINLTTGEKSDTKRNVEYSMFVYESDADNGEVGSFPIKFCPYCGRKLGGEKDG